MVFLNNLSKFFLDLIFPIKCISCQNFCDEYICQKCHSQIKIEMSDNYSCIFCDSRTPYTQICLSCLKKKSCHLDLCLSPFKYSDPLTRKMIESYKYKFVKDISKSIAELLIEYLKELELKGLVEISPKNKILIPIPLHPKRLRWRGFNQAELMSELISQNLGIKTNNSIIKRVRNSNPQAKIQDKGERSQNIKNIFEISSPDILKDATVLLIDDVITSGATINECAKALKKAGATKIIGLSFARG